MTPRSARLSALSSLLLLACSAPAGLPPDDEAVSEDTAGAERAVAAAEEIPEEARPIVGAWEGYKAALAAREGRAAAGLVTPETLALYDRWRLLALHAPADELREEDVIAKMSALMFRQRVEADRLAAMDGAELFAAAVEGGWVGSNLDAEIRVARIEDDEAMVNLVQDGQAVPLDIPLVRRVDGAWKVDIARLVSMSEPQLEAMIAAVAEREGTDEDAALLRILQMTTGQQATAALWQPPRPRPAE